MNPSRMPGAEQAKAHRRVKVTYQRGDGGAIQEVVGRLLVDGSEVSSVYARRGMIEIRAEQPHTNDIAINQRYVISVEFISPRDFVRAVAS